MQALTHLADTGIDQDAAGAGVDEQTVYRHAGIAVVVHEVRSQPWKPGERVRRRLRQQPVERHGYLTLDDLDDPYRADLPLHLVHLAHPAPGPGAGLERLAARERGAPPRRRSPPQRAPGPANQTESRAPSAGGAPRPR